MSIFSKVGSALSRLVSAEPETTAQVHLYRSRRPGKILIRFEDESDARQGSIGETEGLIDRTVKDWPLSTKTVQIIAGATPLGTIDLVTDMFQRRGFKVQVSRDQNG